MPDLTDPYNKETVKINIAKVFGSILSMVGANAIGTYFGDIVVASKAIYVSIACSFFIAYILMCYYLTFYRLLYIYFLKYFAKILAWISIVAILASLIALGVYAFKKASPSE